MMNKISNFLNWLKQNVKDLMDFLKSHAIEIHVKKKETSEVTKHIVISNLFVVVLVCLVIGIVYGVVKIKTIIFP